MATVEHGLPTPAQQATPPPSRGSRLNAGMLSMMFFIGSEVMLFGSFFTAYFFVRYNVADQWPPLNSDGEPFELPKVITAVNTAILVASSFTLHWGEHRLRHFNDHKGLRRGLLVTIFLGATFLIIQINEYIHLGFTPQDQAFGASFFTLTGAHGLHVFVGLTILTLCYIRVKRANDFTPTQSTPLGMGALYWHFVDVVWVLLFFLVYIL